MDTDGVTSTAVMMRYLKNYTENVDFIYGERNDGHGIKEQLKIKGLNEKYDTDRIERSKSNIEKVKNCDLLILIDSSSNDTETCQQIVENFNTDIVILDHHAIERENPYVLLVNPQQDGDEYPNKHLSGAGVVFKVIQVMEDTLQSVDVFQYMDLVAVGMYGDMMRVDVLENRYMIMHGLRNIKNVGLARILKGGKVNLYKVDGNSVGFTISPIINGTARMGNIQLAIDILMTDDDNVAKKLRLQMQKLNDKRKLLQKEIVGRYKNKIDNTQKVLIAIDEESSKGFNGIVAQQLTDIYQRPAIVGRIHNGVIAGSFRSFNGFDLKDFLSKSGLLKEAQGHPQAGGFVLDEENLDNLIKYIEYELPEMEEKEPFVLYDLELAVDEIQSAVKPLVQLNYITGSGFPKVVVRINGLTIDNVECIGTTQETVKVKTFDNMEMIKFRVSDKYASELGVFDTVDVVGQLGINEFYNFKLRETIITNQLIIDDYVLVG